MSSENKSIRKLAAILFADIVGYTALMQQGEDKAMSILNRFQNVTTAKVKEHQGEIIKTYGDGSLILFDSTVDAVNCANEIQLAFREEIYVPLRIGIHVGEVVRKENDVFGNGVNIASRVESMGVAGSVLMSADVQKRIKNQETLLTQSLGSYQFKNVEEPIEIFALANEGFSVPRKDQMKGKIQTPKPSKTKWLIPGIIALFAIGVIGFMNFFSDQSFNLNETLSLEPRATLPQEIRDKRVAVMVFENKTRSEELEEFGTMVSDWITQGLMETGEANVISAANIQNQVQLAGIGGAALSDFGKKTGVGVLVQGRYYLQEDQIIIHANVVDTENNEVLHALSPIQGPKGKMMDLLKELTQKVLGYWSVRKQNRFASNPPKYEAYQKYLKVDHIWGDHELRTEIEQLLIESYTLDPNFYAPLLKLAVFYGNPGPQRSDPLQDSIIQLIDELNPSLTEWEELRLGAIKASKNNEYVKAAELNARMYEMDKSYDNGNYNAGLLYLRANMPRKLVNILEDFDQKYRSMNDDFAWREIVLADGYYLLEDYEKVTEVFKNYPFPKMMDGLARNHLYSLIRMDSTSALKTSYDNIVEEGFYNRGGIARESDWLLRGICSELYLLNKKELLGEYTKKLKEWADNNNEAENYDFNMGWVSFYNNDIEGAIDYWEDEEEDPQRKGRLMNKYERLGVCYSLMSKKDEAAHQLSKMNEIIENLRSSENTSPFWLGRNIRRTATVLGAMGNNKEALKALNESLDYGQCPTFWKYQNFLEPLFSDPEFQEMVRIKG